MLYSVAVVWDSEKNNFFTYYENQFEDLFKHLTCGFTVVGFNHAYFDYKVLSGYGKSSEEEKTILNSLLKQKNTDILLHIKKKLGFRLRLADKQEKKNFIIGGQEIFQAFLPMIQRIYLSVVQKKFQGDTYLPAFESDFQLVENTPKKASIPFLHQIWERKH